MALCVKAFDASRGEVCTDAEWLQSKEESPPFLPCTDRHVATAELVPEQNPPTAA